MRPRRSTLAAATACLAILLASPLSAQAAQSISAGHAAFAEGRYDEALRQYRRAQGQGAQACYGRDWCLDELIATVEERRRLGAIAPADTHRIGLIFVTEIRTTHPDGRVTSRRDVTDEHRARWRVHSAFTRQVVEAFSNGGMTLAFDTIDAVFTHPAGGPDTAWYTDQLDIDSIFRRDIDRHDSYVTFSTTIPFGLGLARHFPLVAGVIYGPNRGVAQLNPTYDWTFLLHEWFHGVEFITNIQPAHGYMDSIRTAFPGWSGRTEFDYFRWHFRNTIAPDWSRVSFRKRWPAPSAFSRAAWTELARWYADVPLQRRLEARRIYEASRRLPDSLRIPELERALNISPFYGPALRDFDRVFSRRRPEAHRWSSQLARVDDAELTVPEAAAGYGTVIGTWRPHRMVDGPVELQWDAADVMSAAGNYEVTLYYTSGRGAVQIDWVALLEEGREIARDTHAGWSGSRRDSITYRVTLPEWTERARYRIRARLRVSNGWTHTNGLVMVRRVP